MRVRAELRQLREILAGVGFAPAGAAHMSPPEGTSRRRALSARHEAARAVFADAVLGSCGCCWRGLAREMSAEEIADATERVRVRLEGDRSPSWCQVCGSGLALDASNAWRPEIVCADCRADGFKGEPGDDVLRAISPRGQN